MSKILGFILILFSGVSLIVVASLFNGIEIINISYKNINIEKLYLKYDKKLTISTPQITILDKNNDTLAKMKADFTVDYIDSDFVIDVKKFFLLGTDLEVSGIVVLNQMKIDFENSSEALVKNLVLQFDKKMKKVEAKKVFVNFKNNKIDLTFEQPMYEKVDLTNSKVSYLVDSNVLKLYLKTQDLLNQTIKNAIERYNVTIPIIQHSGKNEISADIFIPFSKGDFFIESNVKVKDAVLESYDQIFDVTDLSLNYNFKKNLLQGDVYLNHYSYDDINFTNSKLKYNVTFGDTIQTNISSDTLTINQKNTKAHFNNITAHLDDLQMQLNGTFTDETQSLFVDFNNTTNLKTKELSGLLKINYENPIQDLSFNSNVVNFTGDFINNLRLELNTNTINILKPQIATLQNVNTIFTKNIIDTKLIFEDKSNIVKLKLSNKTDFNTKLSTGIIKLNSLKYDNLINLQNKNISYDISFDDNISLTIPKFGLTYLKQKNNHNLEINKPNKILDAFTFIKYDKNSKGNITVHSKDLNDTTISINNINVDINSSNFKTDNNTTKDLVLPLFPKIALTYNDSHIKYDDYNLHFDSLKLNTNKNELHLNIKKDKTTINLKTTDNAMEAHALNVSDEYFNTFLNKKILDGGYLDLNVYADDINFLMGDINFYDTTVRNVRLVNTLTTFVNTTPAIINPLLALPTLFRLSETGFDTNGYYMKNGNASFHYSLPLQQLDIFDFYTNGKMSNFNANSHINFKANTIQANVDISFLKDFTKALNHIPIVGYIFLGDDGEVHTSVDLSGSLDDPSLETHTVKEGTRGITGVIKRILTLPLKPFDVETTPAQLEEHNKRVEKYLNN
ncbi:MAG: AsmA-like C-terminal domain-containing protein [Arcobacteraceae bacterium]